MLTLCKFLLNDNSGSTNLLITKTFGKLGVLNRSTVESMEQKPRHNEWWYCNVVKETGAGTAKGIWVLDPVKKVELVERDGFRNNDITYLFAGFYTSKRIGNVLLLHPIRKGPNWICGNAMRRHLMLTNKRNDNYEINTVMVVFDQDNNWVREPAGRNDHLDPGG